MLVACEVSSLNAARHLMTSTDASLAVADENGMVTREVNEGGVTFISLCEPVPIGGESSREKDARGQRNHRRKCSAKNKAVRAQAQRELEAEEGGSSEGGCEQRGAGEQPERACGAARHRWRSGA